MVVIAAVVFVGLRLVVHTSEVRYFSMEPNFTEGQRLIVSKVTYRLHEPERGDVIVFQPPTGQTDDFIKRIIGLPGERVELRYGRVYIHQPDGTVIELEEPYVQEPARQTFMSDVVPADSYFVLGDNRNVSSDSRSGWTVPRDAIVGKAWLSIWPPSAWGMADSFTQGEHIVHAAGE
jgi:signal peptidase I